jgi:hypothetical protein
LEISFCGHNQIPLARISGVVSYDVTLERRIRELCAQAVAVRDTDEIYPVLSELQDALRQHTEQLKSMVAEYPFAPVDVDNVVPISRSERRARIKKEKAV